MENKVEGGRRVWNQVAIRLVFAASLVAATGVASAQSVSFSLRKGSNVRGEIERMTPDVVSVNNGRDTVNVETHNIREVNWSRLPPEMVRGKSRFEGGQYDEAIAELARMAEPPKEPGFRHEYDHMMAESYARSAIGGGSVSAEVAGQKVREFLDTYPDSFYAWPMIEMQGKLYGLVGRDDLAQVEFARLSAAAGEQFQVIGNFFNARSLLASGNSADAIASLDRVLSSSSNDPEIAPYLSRARALRARGIAVGGDLEGAKAEIEKIIASENPDNSDLFAEAYNTLGYCHFKAGNLKSAANAFLHVDLIFFSNPEAHAEALWYLTRIWPQIGRQDAAWEARDSLKRLYKNSAWAAKLDQ